MMALAAGMHNNLISLGFTTGTANEIVTEQGYDSLEALAELTSVTISDLIAMETLRNYSKPCRASPTYHSQSRAKCRTPSCD